jgi:DASH complex subunit ASK1
MLRYPLRPQRTRKQQQPTMALFSPQTSGADPSWSALVESPLVHLDRKLREITRVDPELTFTTTTTTTDTLSAPTRTLHISTRIEPREATTRHEIEDYEDETTMPVNMSPPVTVPFAQLPTLGRSPAKCAATHIRQALLRSTLCDAGGGGGSGSTSASSSAVAPTPPPLCYARGASASLASLQEGPEFDSLIRRVSLLPQSRAVPALTHEAASPVTPESADMTASTFSSSGEEDSVHNAAHPHAAFLLASRQRGRHDDDDDDDEEDYSLDTDPDAATASFEPVHPFARVVAAGAEDDSFDSLDGDAPEETVFGVRPVKRGSILPLDT